jgi:hypothetical protein
MQQSSSPKKVSRDKINSKQNQSIEKVVRDGKVGVVISHGYGSGWYSWWLDEQMLFDPVIVDILDRIAVLQTAAANTTDHEQLQQIKHELHEYCERRYPACAGFDKPNRLVWVDQGRRFKVVEYDGSESLEYADSVEWMEA